MVVRICIQLYVTRHKLSMHIIIVTHMRGMRTLNQKIKSERYLSILDEEARTYA